MLFRLFLADYVLLCSFFFFVFFFWFFVLWTLIISGPVYERPAGFGKERLFLRADRFFFGRLHNLSRFCTCMLCFSNCAELDSPVLLLEFVQVTLVFRLNVPKRYRKEGLLKKTRDIKVLRVLAVLSFKLDKSLQFKVAIQMHIHFIRRVLHRNN